MNPAEKTAHRFSVLLMPSGDLRLEGILENKLAMYGLLKCAEKALDNFYSEKELSARIAVPTAEEQAALRRLS